MGYPWLGVVGRYPKLLGIILVLKFIARYSSLLLKLINILLGDDKAYKLLYMSKKSQGSLPLNESLTLLLTVRWFYYGVVIDSNGGTREVTCGRSWVCVLEETDPT